MKKLIAWPFGEDYPMFNGIAFTATVWCMIKIIFIL